MSQSQSWASPSISPPWPLILELPVRTIGKARPRFTRKGQVYTPQTTRKFEDSLGWLAKVEMRRRELLTGPVRIDIAAWFKSKHASWHVFRPDYDNLGKIVTDALNRIVYHDDSQVCFVNVLKRNGLGDFLIVRCQPLDGTEELPPWSIPSLHC